LGRKTKKKKPKQKREGEPAKGREPLRVALLVDPLPLLSCPPFVPLRQGGRNHNCVAAMFAEFASSHAVVQSPLLLVGTLATQSKPWPQEEARNHRPSRRMGVEQPLIQLLHHLLLVVGRRKEILLPVLLSPPSLCRQKRERLLPQVIR